MTGHRPPLVRQETTASGGKDETTYERQHHDLHSVAGIFARVRAKWADVIEY